MKTGILTVLFLSIIMGTLHAANQTIEVIEGTRFVTRIELPDKLKKFLIKGKDKALFTIDSGTGKLSFTDAQYYNNPLDKGKNNSYNIVVRTIYTSGKPDKQQYNIIINEAPDIEAPIFTSVNNISINENNIAVLTIRADDRSEISYSIVDKNDGDQFVINSLSGKLVFKRKTDFENPVDSDADNQYKVSVRATDRSANFSVQDIIVIVKDIDESHSTVAFTKASHFNKVKLILTPDGISTMNIDISNVQKISTSSEQLFRGADIYLENNEGRTILVNNSYRSFKNLLGSYKKNGKEVLVNLAFYDTIKPLTRNTLSNFSHSETISITNTASIFNGMIYFNKKACDRTDNRRNQYCKPDDLHRSAYLTALANINYFYNSPDLVPVFWSWAYSGSYKNLDYTKPCGYFEKCRDSDDQENYLYESLFRVTLPNHKTKISMVLNSGAGGYGTGKKVPMIDERVTTGKLGISSIYSSLSSEFRGVYKAGSLYNVLHHELMHAYGYSHKSGMTYGFSDVVREAMTALYIFDSTPVLDLPKYVFTSQVLPGNKVLVTTYNTQSNLNSDELSIEFLSGVDNSIRVTQGEAENQFVLELKKPHDMRYLLRVYGSDSKQVMSQLMHPQ